jgi:hypothetical protein
MSFMNVKRNKSIWFDEGTQVPMIAEKAQQLDTFVAAMVDGKIDDAEIKSQEKCVVELMKEIEPQLGEALHAQVTDLLCELTAYNFMQWIHALQEVRPKTNFRG